MEGVVTGMALSPLQRFKGKRILVTGHTGFKGSWLALWLSEIGAEVFGYALEPPTRPNHYDQCRLTGRLSATVCGDIRDLVAIQQVMRDWSPEIVFHLAAQSLVRRSYAAPIETFQTNVMGTVNLLEACRQASSVRVVINVTSDKCYENKEWFWGYRENDPVGGHDPYSSSKACSELATTAYRRSYFEPRGPAGVSRGLATVRAGNVIGGGDWAEDRLIPDCIRALNARTPVVLRNPRSIRPWQHVLEPLYGYLLLAARLHSAPAEFSGAWNFGPNDDSFITVTAMAEQMIRQWGEGEIASTASSALHESHVLRLDSSKAMNLLGWRPRWDVRTALSKTVEWHKCLLAGHDMFAVSRDQIAEYAAGEIA
jgi:CDP-glucose 4,6-dehydratase